MDVDILTWLPSTNVNIRRIRPGYLKIRKKYFCFDLTDDLGSSGNVVSYERKPASVEFELSQTYCHLSIIQKLFIR